MTKVVVLEKFKKNWEIGSVVTVKDGYARNFLIPNGKAKFATKKNIEDIKLIEENLLKKDNESKSLAETTANKINNLKFTKEIAAKENGELYGSISVADIVSFLSENEISIQKKSIKLGGSSINDHTMVSGKMGYFQNKLYVYGKEGSKCAKRSCQSPIIRIVIAQRSSFYCSECQR